MFPTLPAQSQSSVTRIRPDSLQFCVSNTLFTQTTTRTNTKIVKALYSTRQMTLRDSPTLSQTTTFHKGHLHK